MSNEMYTHKQYIAVKIFVPGQILFKLQGFEIGEMEVEHPVFVNQQEQSKYPTGGVAFRTGGLSVFHQIVYISLPHVAPYLWAKAEKSQKMTSSIGN